MVLALLQVFVLKCTRESSASVLLVFSLQYVGFCLWQGSSVLTQHEALVGHFSDLQSSYLRKRGFLLSCSISQVTDYSEVALTMTGGREANGEHKCTWVVWSKEVILGVGSRLSGGCRLLLLQGRCVMAEVQPHLL